MSLQNAPRRFGDPKMIQETPKRPGRGKRGKERRIGPSVFARAMPEFLKLQRYQKAFIRAVEAGRVKQA